MNKNDSKVKLSTISVVFTLYMFVGFYVTIHDSKLLSEMCLFLTLEVAIISMKYEIHFNNTSTLDNIT